jgi:hypothetical protein
MRNQNKHLTKMRNQNKQLHTTPGVTQDKEITKRKIQTKTKGMSKSLIRKKKLE